MREQRLLALIGQIDDEYVQDSISPPQRRKQSHKIMLRWGAVAACACLIALSVYAFIQKITNDSPFYPDGNPPYPSNEQPWYGCPIPPQPFRVESLADAEKVLIMNEYYKTAIMARQPDRIGFSTEEEQAYEHMVNTFHRLGFLPLCACYSNHDTWIFFFPEAKQEDVGIKSRCTCNDYDYIIYIPKEGYPTSSITDYWDARMGTGYRKNVSICTVDDEPQSTEVIYRPFIKDQQKITFMKHGFVITLICDEGRDISEVVKNFEIGQAFFIK